MDLTRASLPSVVEIGPKRRPDTRPLGLNETEGANLDISKFASRGRRYSDARKSLPASIHALAVVMSLRSYSRCRCGSSSEYPFWMRGRASVKRTCSLTARLTSFANRSYPTALSRLEGFPARIARYALLNRTRFSQGLSQPGTLDNSNRSPMIGLSSKVQCNGQLHLVCTSSLSHRREALTGRMGR